MELGKLLLASKKNDNNKNMIEDTNLGISTRNKDISRKHLIIIYI